MSQPPSSSSSPSSPDTGATTVLPATGNSTPPPPHPPRRNGFPIVRTGLVLVLAGGIWLAWRQHGAGKAAPATASRESIPAVAAQPVEIEDLSQTLTMAAEFRPWQQVSLHAKVSGFVETIAVDVGDHVTEGQVLAQLDVPEMHNELEKAVAAAAGSAQEVARAEAAYTEAHLSFTRLSEVAKDHPKLVAQAEVDAATARDATAASALAVAKQKVEESRAEVSRIKALVGYTTITAPFGGIVTRRYVDPGALIQAGTSGNAQPIIDLADDKKLRLVFPVPESSVPLVQNGAPVQVSVRTLETTFAAKVSRFAGKVDRATRTMLTEADIENADGRFKPGMIATAALVVRQSKGVVAVPVQAVALGEKPTVLVVANGEIEQRPVKLGLQTAEKAEVVEGLHAGDLVVVGTRSGIQAGQKVRPQLATR